MTRLLTIAFITFFMMAGVAMAAGSVQMNNNTQVSAAIKNLKSGTNAAVKLSGYDNIGTKVAQLCKEVYLRGDSTTNVTFDWVAPNYETGLYWSSKVEVDGNCDGSTDSSAYYDSDSDSDSDSDGDSDGDRRYR